MNTTISYSAPQCRRFTYRYNIHPTLYIHVPVYPSISSYFVSQNEFGTTNRVTTYNVQTCKCSWYAVFDSPELQMWT